jgi:hypothetical protein
MIDDVHFFPHLMFFGLICDVIYSFFCIAIGYCRSCDGFYIYLIISVLSDTLSRHEDAAI